MYVITAGAVDAAPLNPLYMDYGFITKKNRINKDFSFQKGWSQVKNGDLAECRDKLMAALNITTRAAWGKRLKGEVEPKISEVRAVENVFAEYGITEVWGVE